MSGVCKTLKSSLSTSPTYKSMKSYSTHQARPAGGWECLSLLRPPLWRKWLVVVTLGGSLLANKHANAQWNISDDFQLVSGLSGGFGLGTNSSGSIVAVGNATIDSAAHILRAPAQSGLSRRARMAEALGGAAIHFNSHPTRLHCVWHWQSTTPGMFLPVVGRGPTTNHTSLFAG